MIILGNTYANAFPGSSKDDKTDQCYYNFDGRNLKPATAISVDDLPDVVLQPEFRQELDVQFEVCLLSNNDFEIKYKNHN